jgi:hypothetical protein
MIPAPPTVYEWAASCVFLLVVAPVWAYFVREMWNDHPRWREAPRAWVFGDARWHATTRAFLPALLAFVAAILSFPARGIAGDDDAAVVLSLLLCGSAALTALVFTITTYLMGIPAWLVPPPRRTDPPLVR